jgi:hypothetical protein
MPDSSLGLRPVVRRSSAIHSDLLSRFEGRRPSTSSITSSGTPSGVTSPSSSISSTATPYTLERTKSILEKSEKSIKTRTGSVKTKVSRTKAERDAALEQKVVNWISSVIDERPTTDYEHFIQDGSVLARVMTSIVFNSVPLEEIGCDWGSNPGISRIRALIREIKRYGVTETFEVEDLLERRNIPKVTKCLAQLSKLAASDKDNLLNTNY